ncbi:MAG: NAD(P)/FAD-dependent oxidoreductase [Halobacteriota archaeon]|nr:NAD(P)/FAD-dependent oxidoreductase [Halobacteriota archaeon]
MEDYDVIVVGAGYGGLVAAETSARNGLKTLLLEKSREIGEPSSDTGAVHIAAVKHFDIDEELLLNPFYGIQIFSPNEDCVTINTKGEVGYMVDRKNFFKSLAKKAIESGVDIKLGYRAKDAITEDGVVRGVIAEREQKDYKFTSNITIAADGTNSVVMRKAGIGKIGEFVVCREYELYNATMDTDRYMQIFLGNEFAPGHAAWIYPVTKSHIFFGVAILEAKANGTIYDYVDRSWKTPMIAKRLGSAKCTEERIGFIPTTGPLDTTYGDGIMAVGDAAGQTDPSASEGIRYAMICGEMAGEMASEACSGEDFSAENLSRYEATWKSYVGKNFEYSLAARKVLNRSNDNLLNIVTRTFNANSQIIDNFKSLLSSGVYQGGILPASK